MSEEMERVRRVLRHEYFQICANLTLPFKTEADKEKLKFHLSRIYEIYQIFFDDEFPIDEMP